MATETLEQLDIAKIDVHRLNPRKEVGDVSELAASIRSEGVIQPILVVRDNGGYAAVHGSRRLAAAKLAGLLTIPAFIRDLTDDQVAEIAIVENLQREDLAPLELADGYQGWLKLTGKTQVELAERVGKAASTVANTLRLLKAPPHIKEALKAGELTPAHVRVLFQLADPSLMDGVNYVGSVEDLTYDVEELNSQWALQGPGAAVAAKTFLAQSQEKYPNTDITWHPSANGIDMKKLLGDPPKKIVDEEAAQQATKSHDKICGCQAWGIYPDVTRAQRGRGGADQLTFKLRRVCVSASGAKKVDEARGARPRSSSAINTSSGHISKPKPLTAAQREKARIRKEKEKTNAATRALEGKQRYGGRDDSKIDPKLVKGKLDGELARLALFALSSKFSSEYVDGWRPALWRKIAKLSLKDVKTRTAAWMARAALDEISTRKAEEQELRELVLGHYGIEVKPKAKKKAKR